MLVLPFANCSALQWQPKVNRWYCNYSGGWLANRCHFSHLFCCMHPMQDQGPGCPLAVHSRHFRSRGDAWRHGACIQNMQRLLAQITSNVDVISLGLYWHFAPFMLFTNWTIDFVAFFLNVRCSFPSILLHCACPRAYRLYTGDRSPKVRT